MTDIKDKIVLITGATAGIGRATAIKFAEKKAKLILAARRSELLKQLENELDCEVHLVELDIRTQADVEKAIGSLPDNFKEISVLVNNAGLGRGLDKFHEGNPDGWNEMIDTNVKGLMNISRAVLPGMVKRNRGHVINIGSIAGHEVYPGGNVYCATKHAVDALTKGMRLDLVDTAIRISTVDPGLVETDFSKVRFYGDDTRAEKVYQGYTPLAPEDVAETVVWIAERPQHVQIAEVIILPTAQASATSLHKK